MKIDPDRLRKLRDEKGLTRQQLEKRSGITVRTIQRLEQEPHRSQKTREDTLNRLSKALKVEPGVLTGDLPLPESDKSPIFDQAPKVRLAYDLIKRRYGVSRAEIINMAPLFFVLLAEGSLARRREKLKEATEILSQVEQIDGEISAILGGVMVVADEGQGMERDSIEDADIFGDHLLFNDTYTTFVDEPFNSGKENPFANYLRKLADELAISGVVDVDNGDLNMASDFKFPHYDICSEELDHIANGSPIAKICLETGCARLSEIPEELMAEDTSEKRAEWLEERLPDFFRNISGEKEGNVIADFVATSPKGDEMKELLENMSKNNRENEKGKDNE